MYKCMARAASAFYVECQHDAADVTEFMTLTLAMHLHQNLEKLVLADDVQEHSRA